MPPGPLRSTTASAVAEAGRGVRGPGRGGSPTGGRLGDRSHLTRRQGSAWPRRRGRVAGPAGQGCWLETDTTSPVMKVAYSLARKAMTLATSQTSAPRPKTSRRAELGEFVVGHHLVEEGVDGQARRHGVDPHPVRRGLDGRAPGQGHHPGLGRGVVRLSGLGPPPEHRGVVDDDPAAAPAAYMWRRAARVHRKVPVRVTSSTRSHCSSVMSTTSTWPPRPALLTATSNRPCSVDRRVVERLHLGLVGHVAGNGERPHPSTWHLGEGVGRLAEPALVGVGHDDGGALLDAPLGGGEADAGTGGGRDHHDLARRAGRGRPGARAIRAVPGCVRRSCGLGASLNGAPPWARAGVRGPARR